MEAARTPAEPAARLEAIGITKTYPGVKALDAVSIVIGAGEIVGLVGHNGAGKSTLTRILAGVERPDEGRLLVDGERMSFASPDEAMQHGIALVPQQLMIVPNLSARDNLRLGLRRRALDPRTLERVAQEIGLIGSLNARADRLRPIAQRLLMIGRALLREPRAIILDEPSAALPQAEVERLFGILRTLQTRGIGVLYITHRLDEVLALAERIVVMRQGRVVDEARAAELTRARLTELIVGGQLETVTEQERLEAVAREELLRCEHLTRLPKIRDVSFVLHKGEVLGITGLVGSGRTSLLRLICGIDRPDDGSIVIEGKPLRLSSPIKAIKGGLAYLPEDRGRNAVIAGMRVVENVTLPKVGDFRRSRLLPLLNLRRERSTVAAILGRLQIEPSRPERLKIKFLSGGNQQKAILGRWLLTRARVLAFDEPTEGIDVGARQEVYRLIRELAASGAGVLVASSDIQEIVALSHRVLIMRRGQIATVLEGTAISEASVAHACLTDPDQPTAA